LVLASSLFASAKVAIPPSKAARVAAPKKVAETVTLKTVFEQLAAGHDLPKKLAVHILKTGGCDIVFVHSTAEPMLAEIKAALPS
jgi:hypothetical protein